MHLSGKNSKIWLFSVDAFLHEWDDKPPGDGNTHRCVCIRTQAHICVLPGPCAPADRSLCWQLPWGHEWYSALFPSSQWLSLQARGTWRVWQKKGLKSNLAKCGREEPWSHTEWQLHPKNRGIGWGAENVGWLEKQTLILKGELPALLYHLLLLYKLFCAWVCTICKARLRFGVNGIARLKLDQNCICEGLAWNAWGEK